MALIRQWQKIAIVAILALMLLVLAAVLPLSSGQRGIETTPAQYRYTGPVSLITTAQALSTTWIDLGPEIDTERYDHIGLFVSLTISDSTNARVRALGKHTAGGAGEYVFPISTVGASVVEVEDQFIEFNDDTDQNMILSWDLDNLVPVVQFQVQASAVGTTAGQIESALMTRGY
jgi:hypothetical protein